MTVTNVPPRVTAVVLNWNQGQLTLECVGALEKQTYPCDIVVVDNGSRAAEQETIKVGLRKAHQLILLRANCGFAGGMNAGIVAATNRGSDYIWLVNNDAFPEPNCLAALVAAMDADPTLAATTPKIIGRDGTEEHAGGRYDRTAVASICYPSERLAEPVLGDGFWLNGPCPLLRAAALERTGGFDERFFAYWEEVDLFLRMGDSGYKLRAVPEVQALHLGKVSSGSESPLFWYLFVRNKRLVARLHPPAGRRRVPIVRLVRDSLLDADQLSRNGKRKAAASVIEGIHAMLRCEQGSPSGFNRLRGASTIAWITGALCRRTDELFTTVRRLLKGGPPQGPVHP